MEVATPNVLQPGISQRERCVGGLGKTSSYRPAQPAQWILPITSFKLWRSPLSDSCRWDKKVSCGQGCQIICCNPSFLLYFLTDPFSIKTIEREFTKVVFVDVYFFQTLCCCKNHLFRLYYVIANSFFRGLDLS